MTGLDCEVVWSPRTAFVSPPSHLPHAGESHGDGFGVGVCPTEAVMSLYGLLRLTFVTVELAKHLVCKPAATVSLHFENSFLKIKLNKIQIRK